MKNTLLYPIFFFLLNLILNTQTEQSIEGDIDILPGFVLGSALGAVFMSISTIIVANNAQLLKRKIGKK